MVGVPQKFSDFTKVGSAHYTRAFWGSRAAPPNILIFLSGMSDYSN